MIRLATEADLPAILEIYAPYVLEDTASFEYEVPSAEAFLARFRQITADFPWLVWEEQGEVLGYAYGSRPHSRAGYAWTAESSVYLRRDVRGRGIGKRLCRALEKLLALQGYRLLYAIITSENRASLDFHARTGYTLRAEFPGIGVKFGRNLGVIWMEKWLKSADIPTEPPTPWRAFVRNDKNRADILGILTVS